MPAITERNSRFIQEGSREIISDQLTFQKNLALRRTDRSKSSLPGDDSVFTVFSGSFITAETGQLANLLYIIAENFLEIRSDGGELVASYTFPSEFEISCCSSCWQSGGNAGLVVGLNSERKSFVCYFDILSSSVLSVVQLPCGEIVSLEVAADGLKNGVDRKQRFHPVLHNWQQICISGTTEGHAFLFDMGVRSRKKVICDFQNPVKLNAVAFHELSFADAACVDLIPYFLWEQEYRLPQPSELIYVSAIKFCDPSGILAIGFSCGDILFFSLTTGVAQRPVANDDVPGVVRHFAVQEPENDPRPTLFLWVVYSPENEAECVGTSRPFLELFQLSFEEKTVQENLGPFYEVFSSYASRFTWFPRDCLKIISCRVVIIPLHYFRSKSDDSSFIREGGNSRDTSLFCVTWLNSEGCLRGGLFDLNAWYLAQMPQEPSFAYSTNLCPYLSLFFVEKLADNSEQISDLAVLPESVKRFSCGLEQDIFYCPSARSFEALVLSSKGLSKCHIPSVQDKVVAWLEENCLDFLKNVTLHTVECLRLYGLIDSRRLSRSEDTRGKEEQCSMLLRVLLNCSKIPALCQLIDTCSDDLELQSWIGREWLWKEVEMTKEKFDLLVASLFDFSGPSGLSRTFRKYADHCRSVLKSLCLLHRHFVEQQKFRSVKDHHDLECRQEAADLVSEYVQMTLWFLDFGMLPETKDTMTAFRDIEIMVARRRKQAAKESITLFVERLTEEVRKTDTLLVSSHHSLSTYPPKSFLELLGLYLAPGISTVCRRSLVAYFLLDVLEVAENDFLNIASRTCDQFFLEFLSSIDESLFKYVLGQWCLDCGLKEKSERAFLDAIACGGDCADWLSNGSFHFKFTKPGKVIGNELPECFTNKGLSLNWAEAKNTNREKDFVKSAFQTGHISFAFRLPELKNEEESELKSLMEEKRNGDYLSQLYELSRHRYWNARRLRKNSGKSCDDWYGLIRSVTEAAQKLVPTDFRLLKSAETATSGTSFQPFVSNAKPLSVEINKVDIARKGRNVLTEAVAGRRKVVENIAVASPLKKPSVEQTRVMERLGKRKMIDDSVLGALPNIFATPSAPSSAKKIKTSQEQQPSASNEKDRRQSSRRVSLALIDEIRNLLQTPEIKEKKSVIEEQRVPTSIMKSTSRLEKIKEITGGENIEEQRHLRFDIPGSPDETDGEDSFLSGPRFPKETSPKFTGFRHSVSPVDDRVANSPRVQTKQLIREPLHGEKKGKVVPEASQISPPKLQSYISSDEDDMEVTENFTEYRSFVVPDQKIGKRFDVSTKETSYNTPLLSSEIPDLVTQTGEGEERETFVTEEGFLSSDDDEITLNFTRNKWEDVPGLQDRSGFKEYVIRGTVVEETEERQEANGVEIHVMCEETMEPEICGSSDAGDIDIEKEETEVGVSSEEAKESEIFRSKIDNDWMEVPESPDWDNEEASEDKLTVQEVTVTKEIEAASRDKPEYFESEQLILAVAKDIVEHCVHLVSEEIAVQTYLDSLTENVDFVAGTHYIVDDGSKYEYEYEMGSTVCNSLIASNSARGEEKQQQPSDGGGSVTSGLQGSDEIVRGSKEELGVSFEEQSMTDEVFMSTSLRCIETPFPQQETASVKKNTEDANEKQQYFFSTPNIIASPELVKTVSNYGPDVSFVFSPPLTRSKSRTSTVATPKDLEVPPKPKHRMTAGRRSLVPYYPSPPKTRSQSRSPSVTTPDVDSERFKKPRNPTVARAKASKNTPRRSAANSAETKPKSAEKQVKQRGRSAIGLVTVPETTSLSPLLQSQSSAQPPLDDRKLSKPKRRLTAGRRLSSVPSVLPEVDVDEKKWKKPATPRKKSSQ